MHHPTKNPEPFDPATVEQSLRAILQPGQVTELRVLEAVTTTSRRPLTLSGYFDDPRKAAESLAVVKSAQGFYFIPNPVKPELLARRLNKLKEPGKEPLTNDEHIVVRRWLLVDCDPVRPAGIASSDAEHDAALALVVDIDNWLMDQGWPAGISADSGNGGHLMYRIDLPTDDGGLVERCLKALAARFDDAQVKVDQTVFNPSRIWKLYGTLAGKGDADAASIGRPQRMAKLLNVPEVPEVVTVDKLEALGGKTPATATAQSSAATNSKSGGSFDLERWIQQHALQVRGPESWKSGGRIWVFPTCPWNPEHTNGSAYVTQAASGAIGAGCHHNGCKANDWHALRDAVEPGWREQRERRASPLNRDKAPGNRAGASGTTWKPMLTCMADVEARPVNWLWPQRIAAGRITLLVGMPGAGKSFFTCDSAARVTTGTPWPDGSACPKGSVIFICAEDDPHDTIRPRLDAHYADVARVHLLSAVRSVDEKGKEAELMFTLADVDMLEAALQKVPDCRLIVVDPIGSFLGGKTDAHRDNEVRGVLAPVAKLAERYGPAVLVVAHRRKSVGSLADDMALGSRAFTGIARAVWHLSKDPDDKGRRLLLPGKSNLAAEQDGLAFKIIGEPAVIAWERDPVKMNADEALAREASAGDGEKSALDEAVDWLRQRLSECRQTGKSVKDAARADGISARTLDRARAVLKVVAGPDGFGGPWVWQLPDSASVRQDSPVCAKDETLANSD